MVENTLQVAKQKYVVRTVEKHFDEISALFLERMIETDLTPRTKEIKSIPEAFEVLKNPALSKEERDDIITSMGMALSDATEGFLNEYLLSTGFYKSEDDFCQDGEYIYNLYEDGEEPYIDMRLKVEMTVYAQLQARHYTDSSFAQEYYDQMLKAFDATRKDKVVVQFINLRENLKNDIEGLEISWEQLEGTDQLDDLKKERLDCQLYVLRNVHQKMDEILKIYYGVLSDLNETPASDEKNDLMTSS